MAKSRSNIEFYESAEMNNQSYLHHFNRLVNLYLSRLSLKNAPDTVNKRFIETVLLSDGKILWFKHRDTGDIIALPYADSGQLGLYGEPVRRRPYSMSSSFVFGDYDDSDSVIMYANLSKVPDMTAIQYYARKLYAIDRAIDVNVSAQRTPVLISCDKNTELSAKQLQAKYEGNQPFIFVDTQSDFDATIKALQTGAPYVSDKLYAQKESLMSEALSNAGVDNVTQYKRGNMSVDEVNKTQGGTMASRFSSLEARNDALERINKMFGTNMHYEFNTYQKGEFENELKEIDEQYEEVVNNE